MARAALTKLFILVILALIICLPEFFSLYKVSKVAFLCRPFRPCDGGGGTKTGESGGDDGRDMCDPSQSHERWERACALARPSNGSEPEPSPGRGGGGGGGGGGANPWFVCQTDTDVTALHGNASSVLQLHLELSVTLELDDSGTLNLTLYGRGDRGSLHPHAPEEEDERRNGSDVESPYCCLPDPPTPGSANRSRCLLRLANRTALTAPEKLPWKRAPRGEWLCKYRVIWLALVCVVLLTIVTTVIREVYWQRATGNPRVPTVLHTVPGQNDGEKQTETTPKVNTGPHTCELQHRPGLTPIPECETQEDIEMLLNGNVDNCYTAKLHHRGHPSTSSLTDEQVW
ncbi:uncharacterized protein LOC114860634 isoform X2 [Betta splendens]|uniref:Uncharacterized protein LOC114860634 isoform X2 n=1 Tax=Betta splendens TaxID=158456 RepID=A0A6P7N771_BETSP|nr:uncharacterized protein LOC114860634 isoform X2 [Betta splendens]